tara:strand:+ start:18083 stop:18277 length:195 start_codon:yes stop_codon:yes gene_type:complete
MIYVVEHIKEKTEKWAFDNLEKAQKKFIYQLARIKVEKAIKVENFDIHFISPTGEEKLFIKEVT